MEFCFSFGKFDMKYFFMCVLAAIFEICIILFIYDENDNDLLNKHKILDPLCYYIGFLLNIFPELISNKCSKTIKKETTNNLKEESSKAIEFIYSIHYDKSLSTKDYIKLFVICLFLIITDLIEIIINIIDNNRTQTKNISFEYEDDYIFFEFLVIYFLPLWFTDIIYYKHQKIAFIILSLIEIIKSSYFNFFYDEFSFADAWIIVLNIISAILFSIYFVYIKGLMKYKYISPHKCCYMIGMITVPIIILIYFILSFFNLGNCDEVNETIENNFCVNIFELFKGGQLTGINIIRLIIFSLLYGILMALITKTINDFTIYHIYTISLLENFIRNILNAIGDVNLLIILSICLFIELIMILIFLELIEVKFCGLNKDIKKNIELRSITESTLIIDNDNKDEDDDDDDDEIN